MRRACAWWRAPDGGGQRGVSTLWYAATALILADAFDLADQVFESAVAESRVRGSTVGLALGLGFRALLGYRTGRLDEAEADARQALEISATARWAGSVYALLFLIEVLVERDRPDDAAEALAASGLDSNDGELLPLLLIRHGRGRLSLALGEAEAGLRDMRAAAAQLEAGAFPPQLWPWRSSHALALAAAGETEEACRLADQELRLDARVRGSRLARNLAPHTWAGRAWSRRPGPASRGGRRARGSGAALEHARALVELGAALRRAGHRLKSVEPLREGLDLAHRCGASALAARARDELVTAGARPRRDALHGRDALTASGSGPRGWQRMVGAIARSRRRSSSACAPSRRT